MVIKNGLNKMDIYVIKTPAFDITLPKVKCNNKKRCPHWSSTLKIKLVILFTIYSLCTIYVQFKYVQNYLSININLGFPGGSVVKNLPANAGDAGSIPGSGRSPEGNGNPLQYSCLGNPMDRGAWWATVHEVARVGHNLVTKQQQQININYIKGGLLLWLSW